ncbi:unnamed protein product [Trichobilharzia regenti]|nr:unnamed protein product [Trichobilharzia regenti]
MLADDRYRQLMSVSRKHVGYGLCFCVYVTIVSRQSNTLCQTANISEFYDCPPPLSSQESDFSDQSEYFEVCNEDSSSSSSSGCDTTLSLSIDSAKRFKVRKLFHFAAGLVYTSGLLYSPHLLSLASVCLLIVFWCFEWIRRRGVRLIVSIRFLIFCCCSCCDSF